MVKARVTSYLARKSPKIWKGILIACSTFTLLMGLLCLTLGVAAHSVPDSDNGDKMTTPPHYHAVASVVSVVGAFLIFHSLWGYFVALLKRDTLLFINLFLVSALVLAEIAVAAVCHHTVSVTIPQHWQLTNTSQCKDCGTLKQFAMSMIYPHIIILSLVVVTHVIIFVSSLMLMLHYRTPYPRVPTPGSLRHPGLAGSQENVIADSRGKDGTNDPGCMEPKHPNVHPDVYPDVPDSASGPPHIRRSSRTSSVSSYGSVRSKHSVVIAVNARNSQMDVTSYDVDGYRARDTGHGVHRPYSMTRNNNRYKSKVYTVPLEVYDESPHGARMRNLRAIYERDAQQIQSIPSSINLADNTTKSTDLTLEESSLHKVSLSTIYPQSECSLPQQPSTIKKDIGDHQPGSFCNSQYMETMIDTPFQDDFHCQSVGSQEEREGSYQKRTAEHSGKWQSRLHNHSKLSSKVSRGILGEQQRPRSVPSSLNIMVESEISRQHVSPPKRRHSRSLDELNLSTVGMELSSQDANQSIKSEEHVIDITIKSVNNPADSTIKTNKSGDMNMKSQGHNVDRSHNMTDMSLKSQVKSADRSHNVTDLSLKSQGKVVDRSHNVTDMSLKSQGDMSSRTQINTTANQSIKSRGHEWNTSMKSLKTLTCLDNDPAESPKKSKQARDPDEKTSKKERSINPEDPKDEIQFRLVNSPPTLSQASPVEPKFHHNLPDKTRRSKTEDSPIKFRLVNDSLPQEQATETTPKQNRYDKNAKSFKGKALGTPKIQGQALGQQGPKGSHKKVITKLSKLFTPLRKHVDPTIMEATETEFEPEPSVKPSVQRSESTKREEMVKNMESGYYWRANTPDTSLGYYESYSEPSMIGSAAHATFSRTSGHHATMLRVPSFSLHELPVKIDRSMQTAPPEDSGYLIKETPRNSDATETDFNRDVSCEQHANAYLDRHDDNTVSHVSQQSTDMSLPSGLSDDSLGHFDYDNILNACVQQMMYLANQHDSDLPGAGFEEYAIDCPEKGRQSFSRTGSITTQSSMESAASSNRFDASNPTHSLNGSHFSAESMII